MTGLRRGPLAAEGPPGHNLQAATPTSVPGPSVGGERSIKCREFGLHTDKSQSLETQTLSRPRSTKPTAVAVPGPPPPSAPVSLQVSTRPAASGADLAFESESSHSSSPNPYLYHYGYAVDEPEDRPAYSATEYYYNGSSSQHSPSHSHSRSGFSQHSVATSDTGFTSYYGPDSGSQTPSPPRSPATPISLRWDSLAYNPAVVYDQTQYPYCHAPKFALATSPTKPNLRWQPSTPAAKEQQQQQHATRLDSLFPIARHEYRIRSPNAAGAKMTASEHGHLGGDPLVGNFSRPRRPSIKQPSPEPYRYRPGYSPPTQSDPMHHDVNLSAQNQHLWARERGQSTSSNKSTSTFASLPVRPSPDLHYRDSVRGRSRHAYPFNRQPVLYSRTESSGHSITRDPLPRMASMPSDELRSSFRSQLSASTAPVTVQTERSSVLTKSSSITSIYVPVDDGFSVDDVMGIYEKGFRDDSPAGDFPDDDSRPPTPKSERVRRRTALLEAFSDALPIQDGHDGESEEIGGTDAMHDFETGDSIRAPVADVRDSAAIFGIAEDPAAETTGGDAKYDSTEVAGNELNDITERPRPEPALERASMENTDVTRDQYGFRKQNQYVTQEQYDGWNEGYSAYMERRRRKWVVYMKESQLITHKPIRFPERSAKTKRFVRKGIPAEWRGAAWFYYAGGPAILAKHKGVYDQLLRQKAKDIDKEAIERDLHRTFPDNLKFRAANTSSAPNMESQESRSSQSTVTEPNGNAAQPNETEMISSLRHVLHAFSIYNPRIGYCQSLNFLAGLLLLFSANEEQAFWLLNIITRVYLPGTHETSLEGANVDLGVLMSSVQETMPAVWAKIGGELDGTDVAKPKSRRHRKTALPSRLPPVTLCMTAWFMSCFIGTLPIETTLRVWDVFFYEGSKTLFRIALTIFKQGENEIKAVGDPMEIFQVVQAMPRRLLDANALMEACFRRRNGFGHISQDTIEERRDERRANVKLEKERIATGLVDDLSDSKRKNFLFGKRRRPVDPL